jgi:hypothetical protein
MTNCSYKIPPPYYIRREEQTTQPTANRNQLHDNQAKPHNPQNPSATTTAKKLQEKPQTRGTRCKRIKTPDFFREEFYRGVPQRSV